MGGEGGLIEGGVEAMNEKYVVFKRDTIERWMSDGSTLSMLELGDAVVIRRQDVFAEAAFWTYNNQIHAALEVLAGLGVEDRPEFGRLARIADYFAEQAMLAGKSRRKIPD